MARRLIKRRGRRSLSEVEIDKHVGSRVRTRRTLLGLNQTQLGDACGITFQQLQKYESGTNRIGASRLYQLSQILDVSVSYFYEDLPGELGLSTQRKTRRASDDADIDMMRKRETLQLVRAYYRIDDAQVRHRLRDFVRAVAGERRQGRQPGGRT